MQINSIIKEIAKQQFLLKKDKVIQKATLETLNDLKDVYAKICK